MVGKFEIHKDRAGVFRFHLKAGNGEIVATSQGYETKASAKHGIESVKENALNAAVADLTESHEGSSQLRRAVIDAVRGPKDPARKAGACPGDEGGASWRPSRDAPAMNGLGPPLGIIVSGAGQ